MAAKWFAMHLKYRIFNLKLTLPSRAFPRSFRNPLTLQYGGNEVLRHGWHFNPVRWSHIEAVQGYHCGAQIGECMKPFDRTDTITIIIAQKTVRTSVENIEKLDIRNPAPHSSPMIHVRIGGSGLVLALKAQRVPNLRDYSTNGLLVSTQCSDLQGSSCAAAVALKAPKGPKLERLLNQQSVCEHSVQWSPRSPPKKIDTPVILRRMKDLSLFQDISGAGYFLKATVNECWQYKIFHPSRALPI
ncbi:hypothetical protein Bbelb_367660 [Branchiostoma belcheri]|nr:hypothetical protein Bbelb_367660 [Branchiostoma belcheri]